MLKMHDSTTSGSGKGKTAQMIALLRLTAAQGNRFLVTHRKGSSNCISFYQEVERYPLNGLIVKYGRYMVGAVPYSKSSLHSEQTKCRQHLIHQHLDCRQPREAAAI